MGHVVIAELGIVQNEGLVAELLDELEAHHGIKVERVLTKCELKKRLQEVIQTIGNGEHDCGKKDCGTCKKNALMAELVILKIKESDVGCCGGCD